MRITLTILFFLLLLLNNSCENSDNEESKTIMDFSEEILIPSEGNNYFLSEIKKIIKVGNLLVLLDNNEPFLKLFDLNGDYLSSFGSKGEGPGEFLMPLQIKCLNDSLLYIYDWEKMEILVYNIQGKYKNYYRILDKIKEMEILSENQFVFSIRNINNIRLNEGSDFKIVLNKDSENFIIDSIKVDDKFWIQEKKILIYHPFLRKRFFFKISTNQIGIVDNKSFQFKIFNTNLMNSRLKEYKNNTGPEVTNKDKEEYFNSRIIVDPNGNRTTKISPEIKKATKFPKYKPIIDNVFIADNNILWIKLYSKEISYDEFKLFKTDATYIKTILVKKDLLKDPLIYNENSFIQKDYLAGLPVIKKYTICR